MRDYISSDREANAIRLRRSTFFGTFLLVEGSTDKVFYDRFVDKNQCTLIVNSVPGKQRVLEVLNSLENSNFEGILAIVDADFDRLTAVVSDPPNLIRTDTHDLETMLLNSPALEKVIAEYGSEKKIEEFGRDIRLTLLEAGVSIGYLRWVSQLDTLNLKFEGIEFSHFIDEKTLTINNEKLIQEVKNKSQKPALNNKDLQQRLMNQRSDNHDRWQVCCGHDLVEILYLALRKAIGSGKVPSRKKDKDENPLEPPLRLAYEYGYFNKTQIYSSICLWERCNPAFKILRSGILN